MGSWVCGLCVVLCFWGTVSESRIHVVGPCTVNTTTASFDCSRRRLAHIPAGIWDNATTLDLSHNDLDLTQLQHLRGLQRLRRLVLLNLTGNYLPLLEKGRLCRLPSLLVLDLSGCHLSSIEAGALRGLPRLHKLILRDNPLQAPLRDSIQDLHDDWSTGINRGFWPEGSKVESQEELMMHSKGVEHRYIHGRFHRKLLGNLENSTPKPTIKNDTTDGSQSAPSHSWQYLVAVLVVAISVSVLIAVAAKCQLVRRYLASYRHTRLVEGDTVSQCDAAGLEVGFSAHAQQQGHARNAHCAPVPRGEDEEDEEDDDDGFIEDNYIQASERERAQRAAEELEEEEEEEEEGMDEIEFTIG